VILWLLASLALAGNIHIDAKTPILVKLDGDLVRQDPASRVVIDGLDPGRYHIEVCNLFGNTMAFADVSVDYNEEVYYLYEGKRLEQVQDHVTEVLGQYEDFDPGLPDSEFRNLMRKTLKGSLTKKLKQVTKRTDGYSLDMRQTDELLTSFHKRDERLQVLMMIHEIIRDRRNASALKHHFGVESDQIKMLELFE
jgi:hypothetical protein